MKTCRGGGEEQSLLVARSRSFQTEGRASAKALKPGVPGD